VEQILDAIREAETEPAKPQVIIAVTVKGKGISYMENSVPWHSHPVDDEQLRLALQELDEAAKEIAAP
jgi:transketolase